jgi:hypothetical protein
MASLPPRSSTSSSGDSPTASSSSSNAGNSRQQPLSSSAAYSPLSGQRFEDLQRAGVGHAPPEHYYSLYGADGRPAAPVTRGMPATFSLAASSASSASGPLVAPRGSMVASNPFTESTGLLNAPEAALIDGTALKAGGIKGSPSAAGTTSPAPPSGYFSAVAPPLAGMGVVSPAASTGTLSSTTLQAQIGALSMSTTGGECRRTRRFWKREGGERGPPESGERISGPTTSLFQAFRRHHSVSSSTFVRHLRDIS